MSTVDYRKKLFTQAQVYNTKKMIASFQILHCRLFKTMILKDTILSTEIGLIFKLLVSVIATPNKPFWNKRSWFVGKSYSVIPTLWSTLSDSKLCSTFYVWTWSSCVNGMFPDTYDTNAPLKKEQLMTVFIHLLGLTYFCSTAVYMCGKVQRARGASNPRLWSYKACAPTISSQGTWLIGASRQDRQLTFKVLLLFWFTCIFIQEKIGIAV